MSQPIVDISCLSKSFDGELVLAILIYVQVGEFLTLLGPSGCGKTTLLRLALLSQTKARSKLLVKMDAVPANSVM